MPPKLLAHYTLENYMKVIKNMNLRWPINTLILTVIAVSGSVFISAITGYGLIKKNLRLWIVVAAMVPRYALIIPQAIIMRYTGLINTLLGCALPLIVTPLHVLMAEQYFRAFPSSMIDAGRIDGLTDLGVLTRVILPNAKPLLVCLALLKTVETWNDYLWQYIILHNEDKRTLLIGLIRWVSTKGGGSPVNVNPVGIGLAVSIVLMVPFLILFGVGSKYFMYELKGVD